MKVFIVSMKPSANAFSSSVSSPVMGVKLFGGDVVVGVSVPVSTAVVVVGDCVLVVGDDCVEVVVWVDVVVVSCGVLCVL